MFPALLKQHKNTQGPDLCEAKHSVMDRLLIKSIWDPEVVILISHGNKKQLSVFIILDPEGQMNILNEASYCSYLTALFTLYNFCTFMTM